MLGLVSWGELRIWRSLLIEQIDENTKDLNTELESAAELMDTLNGRADLQKIKTGVLTDQVDELITLTDKLQKELTNIKRTKVNISALPVMNKKLGSKTRPSTKNAKDAKASVPAKKRTKARRKKR